MHEVLDQISLESARRIVERMRQDPEAVLSRARETLQRWMVRHADNPWLMRCDLEWQEILKRPVEDICAILLDESDEGQRLRQNHPFGGNLPQDEVLDVKKKYRKITPELEMRIRAAWEEGAKVGWWVKGPRARSGATTRARRSADYDDLYSTCSETFSTLRIFSDEVSPPEISKILRIVATESFQKGEVYGGGKFKRKSNGWFYSTAKLSKSKDTRRHIDLILGVLEGRQKAVQILHRRQCEIDIVSYWVSEGQGGPWLLPAQMLELGKLGIEIWWDVYFQEQGG